MTEGNENAHTISLSIARANELAFSTVAYIAAVLPPDFSYQLHTLWHRARRTLIVPLLRIAVMVCLVMSVMLLLEKLFMGLVSLLVKILRRKPKKLWKWESIKEDVELGSLAYPMVLVQIPLYNERQVYQLAIRAASSFSWPTDRLIIQVLDDSTDLITKGLVEAECEKWLQKGINIHLETRDNRKGYKAGAMKEGMKCSYVKDCDYVAIFDADHQPGSNFLEQTVPYLIHNPDVALVQSRWKFVNADECLMTRVQEMSMDYHFKVEQQAGSSSFSFFGFNGTAGVWRIKAMNEAGGWNERSTVEDMDLAVRTSLKGWKFIYDGSIKVRSELPSSFKAYRYQQHRWACGPANLFRKMILEILVAKKVSIWKKLYLTYNFFLVRKVISHNVTFIFYTLIFPLTIVFPEVVIPRWGMVYVPSAITLLNALGTPSSMHLIPFWVLLEQAMSFHRLKAVYIGLLETNRAKEWVVTEKTGSKEKAGPSGGAPRKPQIKFWQSMNFAEIWIGVLLFICTAYDMKYHIKNFFIFIFAQSVAFLLLGFGYCGTFDSGSK